MKMRKPISKHGLIAASLAAVLFAVTACGSSSYDATQIPAKTPEPTPSAAPTTPQPDCGNPLASYQPDGQLPTAGEMPAGSYMAKIKANGRLVAGVSADSLHLGARNPISGKIEGFDIDMLKAVAKAIFGDETKLELRVISSPQRIPMVRDGKVDIVARNMTINCTRWAQIAFSAEYYRSGQKVLLQLDSKAKTLADLPKNTPICAPAASTSLENLTRLYPNIKPVTADTDGGCLVLFQQGKVSGITGDDTVLAGEAAQDPYAKVIQAPPFSQEPYGLGISLAHPDFVKFVNGVLDQMKASGDWMKSYNTWLAPDLGKLSAPPTSVYGRVPVSQ
jgi:polar amino acid transport system substrate-binding protein